LVYGMDGSLIYAPENIESNLTQLDFSLLPSGTYFLQLVKDDQVVIKKIIKQ
ncbi:MAG: T9SS type A sorting domain-containing protein, partial [Crocinitomix sp.]|nr:T9SS type A sorting domain-containing protein [Crocinitomix sp.]